MILASDLRALRNLARTAEGRKVLLGNLVVIACVAVGGAALTGLVFARGPTLDAVRGHLDGDVVRTLHAMLLMTPLLVVAATGMSQFGNELYRQNQVPMLLSAPLRSATLVWRAFARTLLGWWLFACAMAVPAVARLADELPWSGRVAVSVPVAVLALLAPLLALLLLAKVVLVRWCSGPRLRRWFTVVNAGVLFALALAILSGFVQGEAVNAALAQWLAGAGRLPWLLEAPAALPAALAGFPQEPSRYWATAAMVAASAVPLLLAAACYRRSYDMYCSTSAAAPLRARSRSWPASPFRSLLARTWAETLRVRSNLVFYAFLATVIVLILSGGTTQPEYEARVPLDVHQALHLIGIWQGIALILSTLLFLAVVGDEQKQIALLAGSPVPRQLWLRGKLVAASLPFLATVLMSALAGPMVGGVDSLAVVGFLAVAPAVMLFDLGWVLMFGTWPAMIRVHDDLPLAHSLRATVPVMLIGIACGAGWYLQLLVRRELVAACYGHGLFPGLDPTALVRWTLLAAWVLGLAVFFAGYGIARRNVERLLGPQPD